MDEGGDAAADVYISLRNEEDVSQESSLAWADSCLINFPDDSDKANWETFRDALTEIIDIHPGMFVPSSTSVLSRDEDMTDLQTFEPAAANNNISSEEEVSEIISLLTFETDPSNNSLQDHYSQERMAGNRTREPVDNPSKDNEGVERMEEEEEEEGTVSNGEAEEVEEESESFSFQVFKDDFISTLAQYNAGDDSNITADEPFSSKVTPQEIFKVWDLEIVRDDDDEEDGLVLQLKKALDESSTVQPLNDDQVGTVKSSSIDDLILGISDLSLAEQVDGLS